METPIYTRLLEYHRQNRISFAMPGHKNMRGLDCDFMKCDVTELPKTVDLIGGDEATDLANILLSEFYGSKKSFILTGGSTVCVKIMLASVLNPNDTLLTMPDCHMSVINTCAIMGINIKMVKSTEDFEITPDIKAILLTSPDYYGVTKDIKSIAQKCKRAGVPLIVDEAHGAHFTGRYGLPQSAVSLGADVVCQSAHKTLNALTGAAYIHICSDSIDIRRVKTNIKAFHTSSPSYPIAASADIARATLEVTDYSGIIKECDKFKDAVASSTDIFVLKNNDPTRIVLDFSSYDITGFSVSELLCNEYAIDVEMADLLNIVLIVTPYNTHSDFISLFHALKAITANLKKRESKVKLPIPPDITGAFSPRDGHFCRTESISVMSAVGKVSAATVCMYPPGTAVIASGQRVTAEAAEYINTLINEGAKMSGVKDGKIEVVI